MAKKDNNEEKILTESEKQEKRLREAAQKRKRRKTIKTVILWVIVLLAVAAALWYFFFGMKAKNDKALNPMGQTRTIEAKVIEDVYTQVIDLSGYVEPYDIYDAKFRSTGAVTGVYVVEGQEVKKGDRLASIDNTNQIQALQSIENQIEVATLNGAQKTLELLELQKKNAENNLEYTNLVANFDGVVASVNVDENDYFEAGTSVVKIIDRSKLKATVEIDEIDMQYVTLGEKAYLNFDALPGVTVEAYVSYIPMLGRYTNQGIGVVDVELTIDNPPSALIPGFTFDGTINVTDNVAILIIPSAAVKSGRGGATTVRRKKADGSEESVSVKVKYLGEGQSQVLSGLNKGDTIVYDVQTGNGTMQMMMGRP